MEPGTGLDKYRLREIEQQLAAELQGASEHLRRVSADEKCQALASHLRALQRFTDFAARGIVPEEFFPVAE